MVTKSIRPAVDVVMTSLVEEETDRSRQGPGRTFLLTHTFPPDERAVTRRLLREVPMWLRDADTCNTDLCITYFFRHGQRERVEWVNLRSSLLTYSPCDGTEDEDEDDDDDDGVRQRLGLCGQVHPPSNCPFRHRPWLEHEITALKQRYDVCNCARQQLAAFGWLQHTAHSHNLVFALRQRESSQAHFSESSESGEREEEEEVEKKKKKGGGGEAGGGKSRVFLSLLQARAYTEQQQAEKTMLYCFRPAGNMGFGKLADSVEEDFENRRRFVNNEYFGKYF
ncbi:hypothetical protein F2P81_010416 [Scophthalmus maximus]|uniref:Uncharacterized protein n=1 Tax=Scophthalmus maximus TaxID=52904 RepID=A0A6A4T5Q9_SCOMX|nr:hypothetical protein F2P81_010416 [Scophthalmus maximus]